MRNEIFKAYDIRGIYPAQVNERAASAIGFALAQFLDQHKAGPVVVGHDSRIGSSSLALHASAGLQRAGRAVIDIGLATTPLFYFSVNQLGAAGGLMVTASHNPAKYNGFKLVREHAIPLASGLGLEFIQSQAQRAPGDITPLPGSAQSTSMSDAYASYFRERFDNPFDRKIIIDAGNGAAGSILPRVLEPLGIQYQALFFEPDGRFSNHEANPLVDENLQHLRQAMQAQPGAIGVAFDGDGDRVAFLDEDGTRIRGDLMTALLAQALLKIEEGGVVLYDLRSSHAVPEAIAAAGGEPIRIRVGHAFIKQAMRKHNALCGGELSYHYYFRDFFHCESGILAMLLVLKALNERRQTLKAAIAPLKTYAHSDEINFEIADPRSVIERTASAFSDATQDRLDGLTVEYPDWWFNLRASNTEPLLRLNLETQQRQDLDTRLKQVSEWIRANA